MFLLPACGQNPATLPCAQSVAALERDIARLRRHGQFEAGLARARELEAALDRCSAPAWRVHDAGRECNTLQRLQVLPAESRAQWAASERFLAVADSVSQTDAPAALRGLEQRRSLCEQWLGAQHPEFASSVSRLARFYEKQAYVERAHELDSQALAIRTEALGEHHPDVAESLHQMALDLRGANGSADSILAICAKALAIRVECFGADSGPCTESLLLRANIYRRAVQLDRALQDFDRVVAMRTRIEGEHSGGVAEALVDRGLTLGIRGEWHDAERDLRRGLEIRRMIGGPPDEVLCLALAQEGVALYKLGRLTAAEPLLREAVDVQEKRRRAALPGRGRAGKFSVASHRDLAIVLVLQGRIDEAWVELDRAANPLLVEAALARGDAGSTTDAWQDLLGRAQRALPDSAAFLSWVDVRYATTFDFPSWCVLLRKTGRPVFVRVDAAPDGSGLSLSASLRRLPMAMKVATGWPLEGHDPNELARLGRELYRLRLAPVETLLTGIRRLVILSPTVGEATCLETWVDGSGKQLLDRFETEYFPSALLYTAAREQQPRARAVRRWSGLIVGTPAAFGSNDAMRALDSLPGATHEIHAIAALLQHADLLTDARASEAALDSLRESGRLRGYDFVHFAVHGSPSNWDRNNAILLADASPEPHNAVTWNAPVARDGRLSAAEIGAQWHLNARLVSLAACYGFSGSRSQTDGYLSIGQAFLEAGARSTLVSLFAIDDRATSLLLDRFYGTLLAPGGAPVDAATALRNARLAVRGYRDAQGRQPFASPEYWAPLVLVGTPD